MSAYEKAIKAIKESAFYTVSETPFGDQVNIGFNEKQLKRALKEFSKEYMTGERSR